MNPLDLAKSLIVLMLVPLTIDLTGTGAILPLLLFIVGSLIIGLVLGGRDPSARSAMGLGTAQRKLSAALVVSAQDLAGTITSSFVLAERSPCCGSLGQRRRKGAHPQAARAARGWRS